MTPSCLVLDLTLHLRLWRCAQNSARHEAGAVEFLTKPFNDDGLLSAIRQAIERSQSTLAQQSEMRQLRQRLVSLTPREREVMNPVVSGLLNKQVGTKMGISEITVKAHHGKVMEKMQAESIAD